MKKTLAAGLLLFALIPAYSVPEADTAERLAAEGGFIKNSGKESALPNFVYELTAPRPGRPFSGYFLAKYPLRLRITRMDGKVEQITVAAKPQKNSRPENKKLNLPKRTVTVPDSCLVFEGIPLKRLYTRPNLAMLGDETLRKLKVTDFPPASSTVFHLRISTDAEGNRVYVNGSYAGRLPGKSGIAGMQMVIRSVEEGLDLSGTEKDTPGFEAINLDLRSRGEIPAALRLDADMKNVAVPLRTNVSRALDLRRADAEKESLDLARSAFDGLPSSYLFSVPARQYARAYVLCSPIPGSGETPAFRMVMTRYAPYGRAKLAMPSAEVDLSRPSKFIRRCGSAELQPGNGEKSAVPVYLVEIPLDHGAIQDIIYDDPQAVLPFRDYLDIDLRKSGKRSPVAVYAVTLEETPVRTLVGQKEKGNIFHDSEKAVIPLTLTARKTGKYDLSWRFYDTEKKEVSSGRKSLALRKGETRTVSVPAGVATPGWFGAEIALSEGGKPFSSHQTAVVILPPDTRQAKGADSPYSIWFFGIAHYLPADAEIFGPILQKAGIRSIGCSMELPETDWKKWGISLSQFRDIRKDIYTDARILSDDPEVWRKMEHDLKRGIAQYVKRFPRCRRILLFHESFPGNYEPYPRRVLGGEPRKFDEKREKLERARIRAAAEFCKIVRRDFPHLKIVFGNSCWAQEMIESFAARGFDPALVDYIGSEAVGSWLAPPESFSTWNPAGSAWILRETARLNGFDKPVTATFEWSCRSSNRNELGPDDPHGQMLRQAQWMIRDVMTAHAYGFENIPLGGITDTGTPYNNGRTYGALGFLTRRLDPKPLYPAVATVTRILDGVRFTRAVQGPPDVYLFEFRRADGRNIYALWTGKGTAKCAISVKGKEDKTASEDLFGRPDAFPVKQGVLEAEATESVRYFISGNTFESFRTLSRSFDTLSEPEKPLAAAAVDAEMLVQDRNPDKRIDGNPLSDRYFQALRRVPVSLSDVSDPEKGKCVSVRFDLSGLPRDSWNHGGYAMLRFRTPLEIPPDADGIGMWVKGNASLGRLAWEIMDSNGRTFLSNGSPRDGGTGLLQAYENEFDFTSWRFLHMALSPSLAKPRDWFSYQWHSAEKAKMGKPRKLTGILVSSSQKLPHIFEFLPVRNQEIRFMKILFFRVSGAIRGTAPDTMQTAGIMNGPAASGDPGLIENGGFEILVPPSPRQIPERWRLSGAEFPAHWQLHPTAGKKITGTASVERKTPFSGKNSFRIEGTYVGFRQNLKQSGPETAKLRVSLRARGTGQLSVSILYRGGKSAPLRFRPKSGQWQEFSGMIATPENAENKVLFIQQGASRGYLEIDDVRLEIP